VGAWALPQKYCLILFTPGFSQVAEDEAQRLETVLNGFRPIWEFPNTWLKPGVNETQPDRS
jgi:hypothetical protein